LLGGAALLAADPPGEALVPLVLDGGLVVVEVGETVDVVVGRTVDVVAPPGEVLMLVVVVGEAVDVVVGEAVDVVVGEAVDVVVGETVDVVVGEAVDVVVGETVDVVVGETVDVLPGGAVVVVAMFDCGGPSVWTVLPATRRWIIQYTTGAPAVPVSLEEAKPLAAKPTTAWKELGPSTVPE
jgi:hypothetical protein